jgi:hypothetical protein
MRYNNSEIKYTLSGKPYYRRKNYPQIPYSDSDVYVITTIGDRLDTIAYSYYNNAELWWVISVTNNNITKGSMFPEPGTQLRIPIDINSVLNLFDAENNI